MIHRCPRLYLYLELKLLLDLQKLVVRSRTRFYASLDSPGSCFRPRRNASPCSSIIVGATASSELGDTIKYDDIPEQAFYMQGTIEDVLFKVGEMKKVS